MPSDLTGRSALTSLAACAFIALAASSVAVNAQQSSSAASPEDRGNSRGVIILKAEPKPPVAVVPARCEPPLRNADIRTGRFGNDTTKFDREFSRKLNAAKQPVSLDISEPWPVDAEPPMLVGRWLEEIKASGGKISNNEYCQKSRGLFSFFGRLLKRKPVDRFAAVKSYDAVLQINGADRMVTQILFRRRAPS